MGDFSQSPMVAETLARASELDEPGLAWIEEPTRADDLARHGRMARALRTDVQLARSSKALRSWRAALTPAPRIV